MVCSSQNFTVWDSWREWGILGHAAGWILICLSNFSRGVNSMFYLSIRGTIHLMERLFQILFSFPFFCWSQIPAIIIKPWVCDFKFIYIHREAIDMHCLKLWSTLHVEQWTRLMAWKTNCLFEAKSQRCRRHNLRSSGTLYSLPQLNQRAYKAIRWNVSEFASK